MKALKISDKVYWVGAIDWNIRDFHGYSTEQGTTYNAFLVLSEKPTLIDTVKKEFFPEMMARIQSVIDPKKIEIIISNHAELDHSGALSQTVSVVQPKEIYASDMGVKNILAQLHPSFEIKTVKTGDKIDVGGDTISFMEARMLHWPDSMFSYLEKENILFSPPQKIKLATAQKSAVASFLFSKKRNLTPLLQTSDPMQAEGLALSSKAQSSCLLHTSC